MIKSIKNILINHFDWIKSDLLFLVCIDALAFLFISFIKPHYLIQTIILIVLFVKSFKFMSAYTLIPSLTASGDRFSWKFLQGLPINKRELLISLGISRVLVFLPVLSWLLFFGSIVGDELIKSGTIDSFNIFKLVINLMLISLMIGMGSVNTVIIFPRREYQKKNKYQLTSIIRHSLMIVVLFFYSCMGIIILKEYFGIDAFNYLAKIINVGEMVFFSWWSVPAMILMISGQYYSTMSTWLNEVKSYKPIIERNPKKEWSIIALYTFMLVYPITKMDFNTPSSYRGNSLTMAAYDKDYHQIEIEFRAKKDINIKNKIGFTPMLVAIHEGNLKMVYFLEKLGARIEGGIYDSKEKVYLNGFDPLMLAINSKNIEMVQYILSKGFPLNEMNSKAGFFPIHLATSICNSRMLDFVIKNGANINSINDKGETPLIIAARLNCFSAAVSLQEAGAEFSIADKTGKTASSYFKNSQNKEFTYFLEKHSRLPASN